MRSEQDAVDWCTMTVNHFQHCDWLGKQMHIWWVTLSLHYCCCCCCLYSSAFLASILLQSDSARPRPQTNKYPVHIPIVCSWSITDTDSVLCASEDSVILQSIRNTNIAPTRYVTVSAVRSVAQTQIHLLTYLHTLWLLVLLGLLLLFYSLYILLLDTAAARTRRHGYRWKWRWSAAMPTSVLLWGRMSNSSPRSLLTGWHTSAFSLFRLVSVGWLVA